jgi:hypothetical protein
MYRRQPLPLRAAVPAAARSYHAPIMLRTEAVGLALRKDASQPGAALPDPRLVSAAPWSAWPGAVKPLSADLNLC